MDTLLDVVGVVAREDHTLLLDFENGEHRVFDMKPFLTREPFTRLRSRPLFLAASIDFGTVVWPGELDIAPETLYLRSVPVTDPQG